MGGVLVGFGGGSLGGWVGGRGQEESGRRVGGGEVGPLHGLVGGGGSGSSRGGAWHGAPPSGLRAPWKGSRRASAPVGSSTVGEPSAGCDSELHRDWHLGSLRVAELGGGVTACMRRDLRARGRPLHPQGFGTHLWAWVLRGCEVATWSRACDAAWAGPGHREPFAALLVACMERCMPGLRIGCGTLGGWSQVMEPMGRVCVSNSLVRVVV